MKNENQRAKIAEVNFYGRILLVAKLEDELFAVMEPIVKGMNLDWSFHQKLLKEKSNCIHMNTVGANGKSEKRLVMPLEELPGWLESIDVEGLERKDRDVVYDFQLECYTQLYLCEFPDEPDKDDHQLIKPEEVEFHGQTLLTFEVDGEFYTAARPIVEHMGLAWRVQQRKIQKSSRWDHMVHPFLTSGGIQKMLCLPNKKLNTWLFSINPAKVKPEFRDTVIQYHEECSVVLHDYWHKGKAENPRFKARKSIGHVKALRLSKAFVESHMNVGFNKSAAMIMAMDNLMDQSGYDYAAALGRSRLEEEKFIIDRYGPASRYKASHYNQSNQDSRDDVFCDWLSIILDDPRLWKKKTSFNIQEFYNDYVIFCKTESKDYFTYNGWQRKIRNIFREYVKRAQKSGESRRYYEFSDLAACRKQFEKYVGEELWPPSLNCLDIN